MAVLWMASFDMTDTNEIFATNRYTLVQAPDIVVGAGRHGTNACHLGGTGQPGLRVGVPTSTTLIMGFSARTEVNANNICCFRSSTTILVKVYLDATSKLVVSRGNQVETLGTGTTTIGVGSSHYIEIKVLFSATVGTVDVRVDGVAETGLTGLTGLNTGGANADGAELGTALVGVNNNCYFDDWYVVDTTGGSPTNTFLGDVRVQALIPTENGASSQLVGSDADSTDNYLLVDEAPPNGDTDYVESSTATHKDTYVHGNLTPTSGTVYAVMPALYAKKTDAGTRKIASVARLTGGTEADSADHTLTSSYDYYHDIREAKPGGGVWSISDVNDAQFGVKVTA